MVQVKSIMETEPTVINTQDGSWLAVAGPGAPIRVGAFGSTESDARLGFQVALERVVRALSSGEPDNETK